MCYLLGFITGILFLAWEPYKGNRTVRFHAWQSIFLFAAWFIINLAVGIIVPYSLTAVMGRLLQLAGFGIWLFVMWKAYNGQPASLPVIGDLAAKQA
jgi:uncharacterized membrane protein